MEELFNNIKLKGAYEEAFKQAVIDLGLDKEEAKLMETVVGVVQTIATVEKLPLQLENAVMKSELEATREEARVLKARANALEEANKKLTIENSNLLESLKAMKELSIAEDKIESTIDPTFLAWVEHINNNRR